MGISQPLVTTVIFLVALLLLCISEQSPARSLPALPLGSPLCAQPPEAGLLPGIGLLFLQLQPQAS